MKIDLFKEHYKGVAGGVYYTVRTMDQFNEMMQSAERQKMIAVDTETSGLDWVRHQACGIVLGWGAENNYYLPIDHKGLDGGFLDEKQLDIEKIRPRLGSLLENPNIVKAWWNGKYDLHILSNLGFEVNGVFHDGLIESFLLDENEEHGLKFQSCKNIHKKADMWEKSVKEWRINEGKRRRKIFSEMVKTYVEEYKQDPDKAVLAAEHAEGVCSELEFADEKARMRKFKAQILVAYRRMAKEKLLDSFYAKNKIEDISYDYIPIDIMTPYACADTHYTFLLVKKFLFEIIENPSLRELYINEMALLKTLYEIERNGAKIDRNYLEKIGPEIEEEASRLEAEIYEAVGYSFNVNSTQELIKALLDAGCKLKKLSKKTQEAIDNGEKDVKIVYSADKYVLEQLAATHPFAKKILDYRALVKLKSTYVDSILVKLDNWDYIHGSFNQNVRTGRMSSYNPNLQNLPGNDKRIRIAFINIDDDHVYVFIDYSQVELRLTAHFSQDPELLSCYPFEGEGRDVHSLTCAEVLMDMSYESFLDSRQDATGHDEDNPLCECPKCHSKFKRDISKRVNFGIIYGAGAGAIQRQVSTPERPVSVEECKTYIEGYLNKYSGVRRWISATQKFLWQHGYVQNAFGRYRRFPGIKRMDNKNKFRAYRQGCNFMIQGTAADLFKYALVRVNKIIKGTGIKLVNVVHDEIQFYWPKNQLGLLKDVIHEMEDFNFSVPIVAEVSYSTKNWGHKIELQ